MTERKKNSLLKKINALKKEMAREKKQWGGYHDGRGLRYSIAELYFQLGDFKKTNRYLSWFDKTFPTDATYSYFKLGAAQTKFHLKKMIECKQQIIAVISDNTYLIHLLAGAEIENQDKYEWEPSESLAWAGEHLKTHKALLDSSFTEFLSNFIQEEHFKKYYKRYISIKKLLVGMEVSAEQTNLLNAGRDCIKEWQKEIA